MGAVSVQVVGVRGLGVQGVGGQDHPPQGDPIQHGAKRWDLVSLGMGGVDLTQRDTAERIDKWFALAASEAPEGKEMYE